MPKRSHVSISVIRRLPRYYRFSEDIVNSGVTRISSKELSERMGLTASQIRQDFNCFGEFGQQGYGYNTKTLRDIIGSILGVGHYCPAIVIGAGNIGKAISLNMKFDKLGFRLCGIFDISPSVIGRDINGFTVMDIKDLESFCARERPKVAVFTVPKSSAQELAGRLVKVGITGIWNFSHYDFTVNFPNLVVENVHLADSLMTLSYLIGNSKDENDLN